MEPQHIPFDPQGNMQENDKQQIYENKTNIKHLEDKVKSIEQWKDIIINIQSDMRNHKTGVNAEINSIKSAFSTKIKELQKTFELELKATNAVITGLNEDLNRLGDGIRSQRSLLNKIFLAMPGTLAVGLIISGIIWSSYKNTIETNFQTVVQTHTLKDSILQVDIVNMKKDMKEINSRLNTGFNEIKNLMIKAK